VAVIGYVSVGKTTVINALFGAEYGEVSMRRCTAVVNHFRTFTQKKQTTVDDTTDESEDDLVQIVEQPRSPSATLKESTVDNAEHRNSDIVCVKTFDIQLDEPLHEMRDDTKLVIVDIPGINEAGTSSKYKDYVNANWHTFDIAVVVMDGRQGVNTEEQLDLLKLAKQNSESVRDIPIIVTLNKIDDSENEEQQALLKESRAAVEHHFQVTDREKALQTLLTEASVNNQEVNMAPFLPAVVPISAMHAFLYRCGSRLSFEDFCKMDKEFIDNIGKESYGRQWKRFNDNKKLEKAFEAVSDEDQRQDGLRASNIDSFVKILACCIGGAERQGATIRKQVDVTVDRMSRVEEDYDLGLELLAAYRKLSLLGLPTEHLRTAFWAGYDKLSENALDVFEISLSPNEFARPLKQLASYLDALHEIGRGDETTKVCNAAKELVLRYAVKIFENEDKFNEAPRDFSLILGSMLLVSHDSLFAAHFGPLKLELDLKYTESLTKTHTKEGVCEGCSAHTVKEYGGACDYCSSCKIRWITQPLETCPFCLHCNCRSCALSHKSLGGSIRISHCGYCCNDFRYYQPSFSQPLKVENGRLVPANKAEYEKIAAIVVPDSIEDSNHFGYPFWQCCRVLEASANQKK